MSSLGGCLKRLSFSKDESTHIRRLAKAQREDGLSATEANLAAVDELIEDTLRIRQSVLDQLKTSLSPSQYRQLRRAPAEAVVNIGLNVNDGSTISAQEALSALKLAGATVLSHQVRTSNTEPTLIAELAEPLSSEKATALSATLKQDAIAQRLADGTGALYGPAADKWGPFNPEYFLGMEEGPALNPKGTAKLVHYSKEKDLAVIDPKYHGTGQIGAERLRQMNEGKAYIPRSFFYRAGTKIEPRFKGMTKYQVEVPESSLVDLATLKGTPTERERAAKKAGYKGYYNSESSMPNVVAMFEPVGIDGPRFSPNTLPPYDHYRLLRTVRPSGKPIYTLWGPSPNEFIGRVMSVDPNVQSLSLHVRELGTSVDIPYNQLRGENLNAQGKRSPWVITPTINTTGGVVEERQLEDLRSDPLFSPRTWVSQIEKVLEQKMPKSASAAQVKGILSPQNGIKQDELQEMGIDEYLASKDKFDKHNVMEWVRAHQIQAEKVEFSDRAKELYEQAFEKLEAAYEDDIAKAEMAVTTTFRELIRLKTEMDRPERPRREGLVEEITEARVRWQAATDARNALMEELENQRYRLQEENRSTKFDTWQLPGGANYKEVFVTLPYQEPDFALDDFIHAMNEKYGTTIENGVTYPAWTTQDLTLPEQEDLYGLRNHRGWRMHYREADDLYDVVDPTGVTRATLPRFDAEDYVATQVEAMPPRDKNWKDGHEPYDGVINPVVRLRMNDRTTVDGQKLLFLEEVQPPNPSNQEKMPKWALKRWREIGLKQALRIAADGDYDAIGWTTGAQQADRYSLRNQIDELIVYKDIGRDTYWFRARKNNEDVANKRNLTRATLEEHIGKELADSAIAGIAKSDFNDRVVLSGLDLDLGGQGLMKVYDQDLVNAANALAKKWGVKVKESAVVLGGQYADERVLPFDEWMEETRPGTDTRTMNMQPYRDSYELYVREQTAAINRKGLGETNVPTLPVTDAMKTVAKEGLPLFNPKQTETPEFKAWFGDSKVVNEDGSPKVVYHGTERGRFSIFQTPSFFTEEKAEAIGYATLTDVDALPDVRYVSEREAPPIPSQFDPFTDYVPVADDIDVPNKIFVEDGTNRLVFWNGQTNPVGDKNIRIVSGVEVQDDRPVRTSTEDRGASHPEAVRARQIVQSAYLSIQHPIELPWHEANLLGKRLGATPQFVQQRIQELKDAGYDGIVTESDDARMFQGRSVKQYIAFEPTQIKSAKDNTGAFDPNNPDIRFAPKQPKPTPKYQVDQPGTLDKVVRVLQDKAIDIKRIVESVQKAGLAVPDELNPILKEEMYMKRAEQRASDFTNDELRPLVKAMQLSKVTLEQLDRYLQARHIIRDRVNHHLQQINPDLQGTPQYDKLAGMTDAEARAILAKVDPKIMEPLAKRVDTMIEKTRDLMVAYGLEKQSTIDQWRQFYTAYVPLHREGFEEDGHPTGTGRSVRGSTVKGRTGSDLGVTNILANVAQARDQIITRGEKQRPVIAMAGLMMLYPNPEIATLDKPAQIQMTDPATGLITTVPGNLTNYTVPTVRRYDPADGVVKTYPDPMYKGRDNVVNFRIDGQDYAIVFNERNDRAMEAAKAFKELDTAKLNGIMAAIAPYTRYLASINTQYNPIFGIVNFVRDAQFAMLALGSTPLAGQKIDVLKNAVSSLAGIYQDARAVRLGRHPSSATAQMWERFQHVGGPTGYRDLFFSSTDRAAEIERMLKPNDLGLITGPQALGKRLEETWLLQTLSDYNTTMENSLRLGVFMTAVQQGMSDIQAASYAKNITVNFNKKGQIGAQMGSLFAFFNANVQGTARIFETVFERTQNGVALSAVGKKIVVGGLLVGILQTFALAMAGFGDDEPPEYIKARNLVIPIPGTKKGYGLLPMPLGFNLLPNVGRAAAEAIRAGLDGRDIKPMMRLANLVGAFYGTFSPLGGTGGPIQEMLPTVADPIAAVVSNKDWTGKNISKEDQSSLDPTPGHTRTRDTASYWATFLSKAINWATGGTNYTPGALSPTPDMIDYLVEQATGGIGRELSKTSQVIQSLATGEELPFYKVPLAGRFAGSAEGTTAIRSTFYDNVKAVNLAHREFLGRAKDRTGDAHEYLRSHPEGRLYESANSIERTIGELQKVKRDLIKQDAPRATIRMREEQITGLMKRFNDQVEGLRKGGNP